MESRNSRLVKPGTAGRPTGRSANRTTAKVGGRKNSRAANDAAIGTVVYTGSTNATVMSGQGAVSVRTSDAQGFKNMPMGRTTEMFNPVGAGAKKDGFFVHKRGQDMERQQMQHQPMTMEQLAREGAQQAMASAGSEEDETTAMSDLQSLQNFSYYGRRFNEQRNNRLQESPVASDAVSVTNAKLAMAQNRVGRKESGTAVNNADMSHDTMSENVSNFTGFYNPAKQQPQQHQQAAPEYRIEEKMNDNLMKQFQPMMLSDNVTMTKRPSHNNHDQGNPNLVNSVSDFSQLNDGGAGGTQSRAQLFAQAKETLMAQQRANQQQNMAKTQSNFGSMRNASNNRAAAGQNAAAMTKTTQNFMPKKTGVGASAAKVLPPKLPPRAAMSPAVNSFNKGKNLATTSNVKQQKRPQNLLNASQQNASVRQLVGDPRDNMYYPNEFKQGPSSGLNSTTNDQTEIVYKRGARSISKRRTTSNNQNQNQLNLTTTADPTTGQDGSSIAHPGQVSRQNLLGAGVGGDPRDAYQSASKKQLLNASDSKMSLNTEQRAERYQGACVACRERRVDGHDHSISHSLEGRLEKFNQNFKPTGHCKRHDVMGCEKCSMGSSKGSRVSSLDSGGLISGGILQRHKAATRSDIGLNKQAPKVTKSVTRQMKRPRQMISGTRNSMVQKSLNADDSSLQISSRIRSLPREESQTVAANTPLVNQANRFGEIRRSTKNAEVRQLTGQLMQYGKRGNRPSANQLPKPNSFAISEVKVRLSGREDGKREDSSDSRGFSEYVPLKGNQQRIPNFSRILSAKTNQTSIQRREMQTKLQQRDHSEIRKEEIQKLAKEWEGDPHDPAFWEKFQAEDRQADREKRELMQGQTTKARQEDVLDKQSNVFRQLREQDELMSNRDSMLGTQTGFGAARNHMDAARRSAASFFTNNNLQTHADEPICTELDQNEYSMFQQNQLMLQSTNHLQTTKNGRPRLAQDPSAAVLTDYDIADEVGQQFGQSFRHQLEFRDQNAQDAVPADQNIDDLKKQQQLLESKAPRQIDDASIQQQLFSGQTIKTGASPAMPFNKDYLEEKSSSKRASAAKTHSDATAGFPSAHSKEKKSSKPDNKQTSGFENQGGKDSEDAESFDEEKQKTQVLNDLAGSDSDEDDKEPEKPADASRAERENNEMEEGEEAVSERSGDDEDEQRRKEIDRKTMANVVCYDDWLEAQTQKAIERQSQAAMSPHSSKMSSMPKKGVVFGGADLRNANMTQMITKSRKQLNGSDDGAENDDDRSEKADLVENIREGTKNNARPKTRGEPSSHNLDIKLGEPQTDTNLDKGSNFSARRNTHNNTTGADNQLKKGEQSKFTSTQKSPNLNCRNGADHLSSRSPAKTNRGLTVMQSKGMITSEGGKMDNIRSKASMTNFASSLREDELMISSSVVGDPLEQSAKPRPASKKGTASRQGHREEQLAIQEESSSLKSVSPLTENSTSRKSHHLTAHGSPASKAHLPPTGKQGLLPPKSPFVMKAKKIADPTSPKASEDQQQQIAANYVSFAGQSPKASKPTFLPEVRASPSSRREDASSVLSPSRQSSITNRRNESPSYAQMKLKRSQHSPSSRLQDQSPKTSTSKRLEQQVNSGATPAPEMAIASEAKPAEVGQRNQAVHDFIAFEDSDSDDFGVIVKNKDQDKKHYTVLPELPYSPRPEQQETAARVSPPRPASLSKTPSAQFVPHAQFQRSNPAAMPQLTPFEKVPPVAKTPNTGLSSAKIKAVQAEQKRKTINVAGATPVPQVRQSIYEDESVNDQVDKIDYNQSNDGMSASFYRQHDQWLAMQGAARNNDYSGNQTPAQPPLQTMHSQRSSRSSNRKLINKTEDTGGERASSQNRPTGTGEFTQTQKIAVQAMQANQKVQELRKSMQEMPPNGSQLNKREEELRQSGTGTAGYKRPQGYVKKALQNQGSKSALDAAETSQERTVAADGATSARQPTPDKFVRQQRDASSRGRNPVRANSSIMSDSMNKTNYSESKKSSGSKKQAFFSKHKDSISSNVVANAKKRETSDSREAARNRLYNQETIASILKRNPELGYSMKDKKPPAAPPRRPKKKPVKPPTPEPEPPKQDPPEEPLAQSPRRLQLPTEAGIPDQESYPTNIPLPMTLPEEPPALPQAFIMPNLFCPVDPDTPQNFEIEPRAEEFHFAPIEPLPLRMPIEPEDPPYPERMIKSNVEDQIAERLEEPEIVRRLPEPDHDDEPMLTYPKQTRPMLIPPTQPGIKEPSPVEQPAEPESGTTLLTESEPERHFMTVDDLFRTHEMSVQCDNPEVIEPEETKEESKQQVQQLSTILEEASDEDNFSVHSFEGAVGKVTVGIQTNEAHFRNIVKTEEYQKRRQARIESTDWALSPIFDDIAFAKEKKTLGGRKLMSSIGTQMTNENCGNQVEEEQIIQETAVQILSQIECEYNVDQLKRKMAGKDTIEDDRLTDLYQLGLNTLKALMLSLRLEKEWEVQIKHQYALAEGQTISNPDDTIKLLIRNKKMYEAKTLIQRLLKMICQRDAMVEVATTLDIVPDVRSNPAQNIQLNYRPQPKISRESMAQIKRLSQRITSQINTLQEEHRIFKRPFILRGQEYLNQIQGEGEMLEDLLNKKFFVDESGTAGTNMSNSFKSSGTK